MTKFMSARLLSLALAGTTLVAGSVSAAEGDTYVCETKYAFAISSAGLESIDKVTFEFTWGGDGLHVSSGWMLTEYENIFDYSFQGDDSFSARSMWGDINFNAQARIMTVYVPRADEMYSYWATCNLR